MAEALLLVGDSETDSNLYYRTHFLAGDPFIYVERNGRSVLVTNSMERGRAEKESTVSEVRTFDEFGFNELLQETGDATSALAAMLPVLTREVGVETVTVGPSFPAIFADQLRADGIELDIDPKLLQAERRRKTAEEIAAIEEAQRACERAVQRAFDLLRLSTDSDGILHVDGEPLTSERLRYEIESSLLQENMDARDPIVAGGPGAADPHWLGYGPLRAGEAIIFDVFPRSKRTRYFADMTRTVVKGQPSEILRRMYEATLRAQEAAFEQIRPGANGREVHEAVKAVYREAGFDQEKGPRYIHGTGHSVGLDIHEPQGMGRNDEELQEGDVLTVEPGLYDPTIGGVRIEDMVLVTAGGYRNLTQFPKELVL